MNFSLDKKQLAFVLTVDEGPPQNINETQLIKRLALLPPAYSQMILDSTTTHYPAMFSYLLPGFKFNNFSNSA